VIQPITLLGAGLCFGVLFLRYRTRPKNSVPRTSKQKLKTAKILIGALVAWMMVYYSLQHSIGNIDGAAPQDPSLMERVVSYLSKL
jgi:hypothetical protein